MSAYKDAFVAFLEKNDYKFEDIDEFRVRLGFSGNNASFDVLLIFEKDQSGRVTLISWSIGNFPEDKYAKVLAVCNEMNKQFRWVKFYLNDELDVVCECDAIVDSETVGEECRELMHRMVHICDEAYPSFMKAKWA